MRQRGSIFSASSLLLTLCFVLPLYAKALFAKPNDAPDTATPTDKSHARVVNLSLVKGIVIERKPGAAKWERVALNAPIEEGASLATGKDSIAEVLFENGSTVRLGELSRLDFKEMTLAANSGHVNHLTLALGLATLHVIPERHDEYVLSASGASLTPGGKAEFRTDFRHGHLRVEVFHGHVRATDGQRAAPQTQRLGGNHVLAWETAGNGPFQVTEPIKTDDWDKWVAAREQQMDLAANGDQQMPPGTLLYRWEEDLVPFGNMGNFPIDGGN